MHISFLLATAGVASAGKSLLNRAAPSLPANWAVDGCYTDSWDRTLPSKLTTDNSLTIDKCVASCNAAGYTFAGAEAGNECHCSNSIAGSGAKVGNGECGTACKGAQDQKCGGGWRLSVYKKSTTSTPPATIPSGWAAAGCYSDSWSRTISGYTYASNTLKPETCINDCAAKGYTIAGMEAGNECFCSNSIASSGAKVGDGECGTPCTGASNLVCGGGWRLSVYQSGGGSTTPPPSNDGWTSEGCYTDDWTRTLTGSSSSSNSQTVAACQTKCANYKYAGLEAGNECYCSNTIAHGSKVGSGECSTSCTGDSNTKCGGGWRLQIYSHTPAGGSTGGSTGSFTKSGCYADSSSNRILRGSYPSVASTNSPATCTAACSAAGFGYAGMEWGQECFCGDVLYNPQKVDDSECEVMACPGNASEKCGNGNRIKIYEDQEGWCS